MIRLFDINYINKKTLFGLFIGVLCFILMAGSGARAQIYPPLLSPFWAPAQNFSTYPYPLAPLALSSAFSVSPFLNPFLSPFSANTGLPALPGTTAPVASALGVLLPPPPLPIATIAGTTITATTALTEVQVRIWLDGPPLTLTLPVPTTIYIIPSAAASGLLVPPTLIPPQLLSQPQFLPPFIPLL